MHTSAERVSSKSELTIVKKLGAVKSLCSPPFSEYNACNVDRGCALKTNDGIEVVCHVVCAAEGDCVGCAMYHVGCGIRDVACAGEEDVE